MIFSVRQVQEKCIEQNLDLYSVFIDWTGSSMLAWQDRSSQMAISLILLRSPMVWSEAVSWHQSSSTCSSPVSSTTLYRVLRRECIYATTLMVPYSSLLTHSQVKGSDWSHLGSTVCWWLCTHGTQAQWPANHTEQVLRCLKAFWPDH